MWENVWRPGGDGGGTSGTQVAGRWSDLRATPCDTLVEKYPASNQVQVQVQFQLINPFYWRLTATVSAPMWLEADGKIWVETWLHLAGERNLDPEEEFGIQLSNTKGDLSRCQMSKVKVQIPNVKCILPNQ